MTTNELVKQIRNDAVTCDFTSITDPLDEAMRTRFMCSVSNEAALNALIKHKEEDLTFAKAIAVALETEKAAKVAKETVHGAVSNPLHWVEASCRHPPSPGSSSRTNVYGGKDFPSEFVLAVEKLIIDLLTVPSKMILVISARSQDILKQCIKKNKKKRGSAQQVKPILKSRI